MTPLIAIIAATLISLAILALIRHFSPEAVRRRLGPIAAMRSVPIRRGNVRR